MSTDFKYKTLKDNFIFQIIILLILLSCQSFSQSEIIIKGKVTDGKNPVSGAIVKWQASTTSVITDKYGIFKLKYSDKSTPDLITAWKEGFFNGGIEYKSDLDKIEIVLKKLPAVDNKEYEFVDPVPNYTDDIKNCGDCHASIIYKQWDNNAHSKSATNPIFLDIYNGTDANGNNNVHPGYKLDYKFSNGNCGNCHAPANAVNNINNVDMNNLKTVEKLGVSCDYCHKIKEVKLKKNSSAYTGVMQVELLRPPKDHQTFFGPYTDVLNPDIYSPQIAKSIFCAPCHQGGYWGVPVYDSYDQWIKSPYAKEDVQCQDCHMKPDGVTTNFAPGKEGVERHPKTIYTHRQFGSRDSSFLSSAVEMTLKIKSQKDKIVIDVEILNSGAGHHLPTGSPMRNMILIVRAYDQNNEALTYVGDNLIPFWGGRGNVDEGNYEGLPGKGFAKILFEDWTPYEYTTVVDKGKQLFPAPQWRTVQIKYDTRIPALEKDLSNYVFKKNNTKGNYIVDCKLIYRRTFKTWSDMKKWDLKDIVLSEKKIKTK